MVIQQIHVKKKPTIKCVVFIYLIFSSLIGFSQINTGIHKIRLPIWTFHSKNTSIYGLSFGAFSVLGDKRNVISNGIRIELPGIGVLAPLGNGSPISDVDTLSRKIKRSDFNFSEIINGINVSSGSWGELNYNGITVGVVAQYGQLCNGIAIAGLWNSFNKSNGITVGGFLLNESLQHNGIQIGFLRNKAVILKGVQIGIINQSNETSGIQIGLWNINEKREFPIINWSFKRKSSK